MEEEEEELGRTAQPAGEGDGQDVVAGDDAGADAEDVAPEEVKLHTTESMFSELKPIGVGRSER